MSHPYSYFCPCPRGLEAALAEELGEIALQGTTLKVHNQVPGGVHCSGVLTDAYRINLHSRIASRVLLRIAHSGYVNENDIYDLTLAQTWEDWFSVHHTIRIDVTAIKSPLRSLEFTTLKIKDAICDRFREQFSERPSVDTKTPDMRIVGFLDARNFTLYLDTSGEALFKRGWRLETRHGVVRPDVRLRHHPGRSGANAGRHPARRAPRIRVREISRLRCRPMAGDERRGQAASAAGCADDFRQRHFRRHDRDGAQ
jgi:putative N6-adenine-specific DNA methylase